MEMACDITEHWVYILWIWKNQKGRSFLNCNREREKTAFRLVYRKEENSREQERKLKKGMVGTTRGLFEDYKIQKKKKIAEGICKEIRSRGYGFGGKYKA